MNHYCTMEQNTQSIALMLNNDGMGVADAELQKTLIFNYLNFLTKNNFTPRFICCYANGVKLLTDDSPIVSILAELESKGVKIIACKTCIDYYNLKDKINVGITATMGDIIEIQWMVDKLIYL